MMIRVWDVLSRVMPPIGVILIVYVILRAMAEGRWIPSDEWGN